MQKTTNKHLYLFFIYWLVLFVLYLPTANAGFVADFTGWLNSIRNESFWDYINRTHFAVKSLYQFTQFTTYLIYKIIGANAWGWHLVHISLQSLNAYLWFLFCYRVLSDSTIVNAKSIAIAGTLLFCVNPYLTEVIVWEPSFHYLQGFLMIVLILLQVQNFHYAPKLKYAAWAALIFLLSSYSLEIFYLTPVLTFTLALYYYKSVVQDKKIFVKVLNWFFLPQVLIFIAHILVCHMVYGEWLPHMKPQAMQDEWSYYLSKPAKYLFQIVFIGRYFHADTKNKIYLLCESYKGIILALSLLAIVTGFIFLGFKKLGRHLKSASLFFIWMLPVLFIMGPLCFPGVQPYVFCDRYVYVLSAIVFMLVCILLSYITNKNSFLFIVLAYGSVNIYFTILTNKYWKESADVIHQLIYDIPQANGKPIILLNLPENMQGAPMIDATPEGEYKLMHNEFVSNTIHSTVYDAMAFNMLTPYDGAHVIVLNDSTIGVTLNQWGTWWWYNRLGGISYKNDDYSVNMVDMGHYYELTLKKPMTEYLILYNVSGHWKIMNPTIKNEQQY